MISIITAFREDHDHLLTGIEYENGKVFMQWLTPPIAINLFKTFADFEAELDRRYPETKDETIIKTLDIDSMNGELVIVPVEFFSEELLMEFLFGKQVNKKLKVFTIIRQADESGISGTGHVVTGMVFSNGLTNLNWLGEKSSNTTFDSWEAFLEIHIQAHPSNDTIINELELETSKEGEIIVLEKDFCAICYEPIYPHLLNPGYKHVTLAKNLNHSAQKAESERKPNESCNDCVSRKIPIIAGENPKMDDKQVQAIAFSVCSCSEKEAGRYKEKGLIVQVMLSGDLRQVQELQKLTMPAPYALDQWTALYCDPDSLNFVIMDEGQLLGYIVGKQHMNNRKEIAHLTSIAVNPTLRQKGIGKKLLETFMMALKTNGVSLLGLEVREQNKSAIEFYKRNGFSQTGQENNFYPNGDNVQFMGRVL